MIISKTASGALKKIIADLAAPNVDQDFALGRKLQEERRNSVDPIYKKITKGSNLIEQGERVTVEKLAMLKAHDAEFKRGFSSETRWRHRIGAALLVILVVGVGIWVLEFYRTSHPSVRNREYALLSTALILHFGACRLAIYLMETMNVSSSLAPSVLPLCFGPVLVAILLDRRRAYIVMLISSFLAALITQFSYMVMAVSILSSLVGVFLVTPLRRRFQVYEAGFLAGCTAALMIVIFGFKSEMPWTDLGWQIIYAILSAFASSVLINALLPLLESIFKITTDLRWLELSDLNHPLLRRMVIEAPGTYHHSLIVANLAERACEVIGAHALQARVCSYFHDIGKLNKPEYFCENQINQENPHKDMLPNMSALVIMAHVKDGVDMAIQHGLVRPIIDTIKQHHGTSQVTYFYRLAKQNEEDAKRGSKIMQMNESDVPRVEEDTFRYPGPNPNTREIGVISLADAVEGASRTMLKPTPQKIEALISEIIDDRYRDGQLDECPLTVRDLKKIADSFSKTILSMLHTRVSYPKDESDADQSTPLSSAAVS